MRMQIIELAKKIENITVVQEAISPFDLQKADELFLTNVIKGIQPITKYRKKDFSIAFSTLIFEKLNQHIGQN